MALRYPRPDTSPIEVAQRPVRVTGVVSEQPVRVAFSLSGTVTAPADEAVMPNGVSSAGADVVTANPRAAGDTVRAAGLVAEVSGRPVFAFPAGVPLYRDLAPDVAGADVAAVQRVLIGAGLLAGEPSGKVDAATSSAIAAMFQAAGYAAPLLPSVVVPNNGRPPRTGRGLPLADTASVPGDGLRVASAAPVGARLDGEHPLVRLETRPAVIVVRADLLAAPSFQVGAAVEVQVGSSPVVASAVLAVSGFSGGDGGVAPGYDVTVAVPEGVDAAQVLNQPVLVGETAKPPLGPAVPLLAVRTDGSGTYVWKAAEGETAPDVRVAVSVTGQANGYAILAASADLPVGAAVVLSGERT